jgi:hypothetical protein
LKRANLIKTKRKRKKRKDNNRSREKRRRKKRSRICRGTDQDSQMRSMSGDPSKIHKIKR